MEVLDKTKDYFSWIAWNIWKARNEKVFSGTDISPLDYVQLAVSEADTWATSQILIQETDRRDIRSTNNLETSEIIYPRCQVDASWAHAQTQCGGGFALDIARNVSIYGSLRDIQVLSPLHAELNALIWAMKAVLQLGYIYFYEV